MGHLCPRLPPSDVTVDGAAAMQVMQPLRDVPQEAAGRPRGKHPEAVQKAGEGSAGVLHDHHELRAPQQPAPDVLHDVLMLGAPPPSEAAKEGQWPF